MKTIEYKTNYPGLKILCKKCGYEISGKSEGGRKINCAHPISSQIYKAVIKCPYSGKRKTRNLKAKNFTEAVIELNAFEKELKHPIAKQIVKSSISKAQPFGLLNCFTMYLDYLNNVGVREQLKRTRSKKYIANMTTRIQQFLQFLKDNGYDIKTIRIDEIDDDIVEQYYIYVTGRTKSPGSINSTFKPLKQMYSYLINKKDYLVRNPFKTIPYMDDSTDPRAFTVEELETVMSVIEDKDSVEVFSNGVRKNRYKYWLKDAVDIALTTGVRREQIVELKFSDIIYENGIPVSIKSNNLKVNRLANKLGKPKQKFIYIPIIPELLTVLERLGLEENKGTDKYILAPGCVLKRITLMNQMSQSFTFFRKKAGLSDELSFKNLRKTYLTMMEMQLGNVRQISGHSDNNVLKNHYLDAAAIAKNITQSGRGLFS